MTFQSENGKAFVGDLTKELTKRSHIAQAHSTTYHPQTNGLVAKQNRTLVNMLRVYCSRYMTYKSTQHSTTGISLLMMLTGREKAMALTFCYPDYEAKKTSPQANVREAIKRQQELNDLFRRKTVQAQKRQRKNMMKGYYKRSHTWSDNFYGVSKFHTAKGDKVVVEEKERTIFDNISTETG